MLLGGQLYFTCLVCSGDVTAAAICPNQQYIVSVTASGSIFRWEYPTSQPLSM